MDYQISKERLTSLIIRIIKSMEIPGLYRVQVEITKDNVIVVALFFETVGSSETYSKIKNMVEDRISDTFGIDSHLVLTIPYSEAKYHLNRPKNI